MAIVKLIEPWAVNYMRTQVRDSLMYHGEQAILLSMYREHDCTQRCPRCSSSEYLDGEEFCEVCYGTNWYNETTGLGGVKDARRAWCLFSDHIVSEQYGKFGTLDADQRQVQCEAFPLLIEHDYIVRVKEWDPTTNTVIKVGGIFEVTAVTRNSLRTGSQYGQTWQDVIGQAATVNWVPPNTKGISLYQIEGVSFPDATISGTPVPTAVVEPDAKVVFYPVSNASGVVTGAVSSWEPAFVYTQQAPAAVWTIGHTLGYLPRVNVIVGGEEVDADIDYPNISTITITFASPQTGTAEVG